MNSSWVARPTTSSRITWTAAPMQPIAFLLCILIALALVSPGQTFVQELQSDEQQSTIHGTVINSVTHSPIVRALVHSTDDRFATLTDGDGHFEITLPKSADAAGSLSPADGSMGGTAVNQLSLAARKPGFLDHRGMAPFVEASPGTETTISLVPEALIKGRVTLSTGDTARGVNLQILSRQVQDGLLRWTLAGGTRSNSSGEFRFAELQAGSYKLLTNEYMDNDPLTRLPDAQLYGFPPVYYPSAPDFSAASTIELTAGQTFQADLSLSGQPYFAVKIPVANGEDIQGMNVSVSLQGQRGPGYSLGYDPARQRIAGSLPNGSYVVEARTYGQNSTTGIVNLRVAGAPVEGPVMTLARNNSITFEVTEQFDETSQQFGVIAQEGKHTFRLKGPRAYFYPRLEPVDDFTQGGGSIRPPLHEGDDSLVVENLAPGRYWLRTNAGRGYVASATFGATDLLHQPLTLGSGSNATVEVTLRDDGAELNGAITGATGQSAKDGSNKPPGTAVAWVYCIPLPDGVGELQQTGVSEGGKFTFSMLAPGAYRIIAFPNQQPELPYRDAEAMRAYENKGQVIQLSAGQKASAQVPISPSEE
jgi:hypothetical protein